MRRTREGHARVVPVSTLLTITTSVALAVVLYAWQGARQYINEPLHATIEAIGGCIAVGMATLLVRRWLEDGPSHLLWRRPRCSRWER